MLAPLTAVAARPPPAPRAGRIGLPWAHPLPTPLRPMSLPASRALPAAAACAERDAQLATQLAAAATGDGAAFEMFYDATIGFARALARRLLRGADVDDALADAYFDAWRLAPRFDAQRGTALAWLLTIVRSRALDRLRRQAAHPAADEAPAEPADPGADPAERLWQAQAGGRLHAALAGLSPAERWVLGLAYFRDLSHSRIAAATGMPLGTVKTHLQRAQARLRQALAEDSA